jgi:hypothetical protein
MVLVLEIAVSMTLILYPNILELEKRMIVANEKLLTDAIRD